MDSDSEAFRHNSADGSFVALPGTVNPLGMVAECVVLVEAGAGAARAAGWSAGIEFLMRKGEGVLVVPTTLPFPLM